MSFDPPRECDCCGMPTKVGDIVWPEEAKRHWFWFTCPDCAREGRQPKNWMMDFVQYYEEATDAQAGSCLERFCRVLSAFERVDSIGDVGSNTVSKPH